MDGYSKLSPTHHRFTKKDCSNWLGKHHSAETKRKIGLGHLGFKYSSDSKKKMSESRKGIVFTNEHRNKMSKANKLTKERLKIIGLKGLLSQQNSKEPTSIEKIVYDFLKSKGIIFEKQKLINGRFLVDVFIPELNTVIECDGNYWHKILKIINKDKAENAYLKKCGYNVIRLSEKEINNGNFKERLVT